MNITSLNVVGDAYMYYITEGNQLKKMAITDSKEADIRAEDVHCSFHSTQITGMDVCMRKQLIATTAQR